MKNLPVSPGKNISLLNKAKFESVLLKDVDTIQSMLELNDNDSAISLIYKKLIQSVVDILPILENAVRKSNGDRGVYQYTKTVESLRGLIIDMQSTLDRGSMGEAVIDKILRPIFLDVAMQIVVELKRIEVSSKDYMSTEDFNLFKKDLRDSRDSLAHLMERKFDDAKKQTREFLQR